MVHCSFPFRRRVLTLSLAALAAFGITAPPGLRAQEAAAVRPPGDADEAAQRQPTDLDQLVTRIVVKLLEKQHYKHADVGDTISKELFEEYFERLDRNRYFFLASDVEAFRGYETLLDDHLKAGNLNFPFAVFELFLQRIRDRVAYVKAHVNDPVDFTVEEEMLVDRGELPWATSVAELDEAWRQRLKNQRLVEVIADEVAAREAAEKKAEEEKAAKDGSDAPERPAPGEAGGTAQAAKDQAAEEPVAEEEDEPESPQERIVHRYENYYRYFASNDNADIMENYLSALAHVLDPHSSYMNWRTKEDFDIQMRLSLQGIGATLTQEDGYTKVVSIVPGGPADQDGRLKSGDLIVAVAQGDGKAEEVIDVPLNRVVRKIRGKKGTVVALTVMRSRHSVPRQIQITRDEVKLKEQEAKSEVREVPAPDGRTLKIGIVDLPSFYADFAALKRGDEDAKSTATDVKRLVDKMLAGDHIDGLIVDLRSNGGGSLSEAIKLTGLFVPEGPVVQVRQRRPVRVPGERRIEWKLDVKVKQDMDGGFGYELPMLVMVNRLSASASEIFAGAMQDYGRAVIVGDATTHGKGTVQTIQPLDRGYPYLSRFGKKGPGALKYTMGKFYRITGASTQLRGIAPDIVFPSFLDHMELGEQQLDHVMAWDEIESQKFEPAAENVTGLIPALREKSKERLSHDEAFKTLCADIERYGERRRDKTVTLNRAERTALRDEDEYWAKRSQAILGGRKRMDEEANEDKEEEPVPDLYLEEALRIMGDLVAISEPVDGRLAKDTLTAPPLAETPR